MNEIICIILTFIIFLILFICINMYLKKQRENFGIYCGRYNTISDLNKSKTSCSADTECQWNSYTSQAGAVGGYCTVNDS